MQTSIKLRFLSLLRMAIKKKKRKKFWFGVLKNIHYYFIGQDITFSSHYGNQNGSSPPKLKGMLPYNPYITLFGKTKRNQI
jgi:hypothetical protein